MRIETQKIREGSNVGETVWICHYFRPDLQKKPLRNVPPTKVIIRDNDELPKGKTVYYSKTHFAPLNKNNQPLSKVISPVDNTGFRSRHGNELFVFTTEQECNSEWNKQIDEHCARLDVMIASAAQDWINQKNDLLSAKR